MTQQVEQDAQARFVYMTASDPEEALRIGEVLVEERLAACVNILPGMTSLYHWKGAVEHDSETVFIAKTRASLVEALTARVVEVHSYECPCVVVLPIVAGNPPYLEWLFAETRRD